MSENVKILFLSANPINTDQLRIDEELREIDEALKRASNRDRFTIKNTPATRFKDFRRALLDNEPRIVHFSGHGSPEGIAIEGDNGCATYIKDDVLAELFKFFADKIECIILNACYSASQADLICKYI